MLLLRTILLQESPENLAPTSRFQALLVLKETRALLVGLEPRDLKEPKEKRDSLG